MPIKTPLLPNGGVLLEPADQLTEQELSATYTTIPILPKPVTDTDIKR